MKGSSAWPTFSGLLFNAAVDGSDALAVHRHALRPFADLVIQVVGQARPPQLQRPVR